MTRRATLRDERGQTMTEFAVVLPVLCLLVFGVIQFGLLFNDYLTLTDAVRTGARKAAVGRHLVDPAGAAEAQVRTAAQDLTQADLDVIVAPSAAWESGSDMTVSASYPYNVNLLGLVVASGRLRSTTTERVE